MLAKLAAIATDTQRCATHSYPLDVLSRIRQTRRTRLAFFVRSSRELRRARNAVKQAGIPGIELSDKIEITLGKVPIGTMHLAKGLEFRAVAVMGMRRRDHPITGAHRECRRRCRSRRGLRQRAPPALFGVHARPRSSVGDC